MREPWTARECATLRRYEGVLSVETLAVRLGRSVQAVNSKRKRLGLRQFGYHDWTPGQLEMVRRHKWGSPRAPLIAALGVDPGRVHSMIAIMRRRNRR
jgi:hypothetical protein